MNSDLEKMRIHFWYWMAIMTGIVVLIATDRWTAKDKFTEYLSNAATMSSLLLGVVAIFYSFIANDSLSKSLANIATVSDEVKQSKDQISEYLSLTETATEAASKNAGAIDEVSKNVNAALAGLNDALTAIRGETAALNSAVAPLPGRFDQLQTMIGAKQPRPDASRSSGGGMAITSDFVDTFLALSTLGANLVAYACVLAHEKQKELSLDAVCEAIELQLTNYFVGFIAAMEASQLLVRNTIEDKSRSYKIHSINTHLAANTRQYVVDYLQRAYKSKPDVKERWLRRLGQVERLFEAGGAASAHSSESGQP